MMGHEVIYLLHIFIIAPLFIYIGQYKEKTHINVLASLLPIGVIVLMHHTYKLYQFTQSRTTLDDDNHDN